MDRIEEIAEKYNKRRTVLTLIRYCELVCLILLFYSLFRHTTTNPGITIFFVISTIVIALIKQGYLISIFGLGTEIKKKTVLKIRWTIVLTSVLIFICIIELTLLIADNSI